MIAKLYNASVNLHFTCAFYNGMLRHSLGGAIIFISLQHFIAPALDLMDCLPSRPRREAIKTLNPRREQESAAKKT